MFERDGAGAEVGLEPRAQKNRGKKTGLTQKYVFGEIKLPTV